MDGETPAVVAGNGIAHVAGKSIHSDDGKIGAVHVGIRAVAIIYEHTAADRTVLIGGDSVVLGYRRIIHRNHRDRGSCSVARQTAFVIRSEVKGAIPGCRCFRSVLVGNAPDQDVQVTLGQWDRATEGVGDGEDSAHEVNVHLGASHSESPRTSVGVQGKGMTRDGENFRGTVGKGPGGNCEAGHIQLTDVVEIGIAVGDRHRHVAFGEDRRKFVGIGAHAIYDPVNADVVRAGPGRNVIVADFDPDLGECGRRREPEEGDGSIASDHGVSVQEIDR